MSDSTLLECGSSILRLKPIKHGRWNPETRDTDHIPSGEVWLEVFDPGAVEENMVAPPSYICVKLDKENISSLINALSTLENKE